jgi:hypothetical protein
LVKAVSFPTNLYKELETKVPEFFWVLYYDLYLTGKGIVVFAFAKLFKQPSRHAMKRDG